MSPYEFSVLRYSYDPLTQEFINVGIVVYAATSHFFQARLNTNYGRASRVFGHIDGNRYRTTLRHLQNELDKIGAELSKGQLFDRPIGLQNSLGLVLPVDDSSLHFGGGGAGVSADLSKTCEQLYRRYVLSNEAPSLECKTRDDVWRTFRRPLERRGIVSRLEPKLISARDYKYEFQHAWKNGIWNLYEPISFDLLKEHDIFEKANKWLGRSLSLKESPEAFKLTVLLGSPQNDRLRAAYQHAENILNKMPVEKEFVREEEAEAFAKDLESRLQHGEHK